MKQYTEYRSSGADWLDLIPANWNVEKLKFNASVRFSNVDKLSDDTEIPVLLCNYTDVYKNQRIHRAIKFMQATANESEIKRFKIEKGDVLITKDSESADDIAVPAFVADDFENVLCGYHLAQIKVKRRILGEYLFRTFQSKEFNQNFESAASGMTRYGLSVHAIKNVRVPIPSLFEQQKIVQFLDFKTGQIDKFISNRQIQIELLHEQKVAIINKAVTKGIRTDVEMKSSTIDWLPEVPAHWKVMELKFAAKMMRGKFSHRPRNDERLYGGKFPFIQTGDVARTDKYITSYTQTLNDWGYSVSKEFPKGTVVITIAANVGDIAILDFNACFPDSVVGFFPKYNLTEYIFYLLKSMKDVFLSESIEGTQLNLSVDRLSGIKVAMPDPSEQSEIVEYIKYEIPTIDNLIVKYQTQIRLMEEYRMALINQATTGKIDVREWWSK